MNSTPLCRQGTRVSSRAIRGLAALAAIWLGCTSGCATLDTPFFPCNDEAPPHGKVQNLQLRWFSDIRSAPDPTRNGELNPGIIGRLYLSGAIVGKEMLAAEGDVTVSLYNDSHPIPPGTQQMPLETWTIDKDTLQKLARKDIAGWGYTLFLPWLSYSPEITRVHMKTQYHRPKGDLFDVSNPFTLNPLQDAQLTTSHALVPGARQPMPQAAPAQPDAAAQSTRPTSVSVYQLAQNPQPAAAPTGNVTGSWSSSGVAPVGTAQNVAGSQARMPSTPSTTSPAVQQTSFNGSYGQNGPASAFPLAGSPGAGPSPFSASPGSVPQNTLPATPSRAPSGTNRTAQDKPLLPTKVSYGNAPGGTWQSPGVALTPVIENRVSAPAPVPAAQSAGALSAPNNLAPAQAANPLGQQAPVYQLPANPGNASGRVQPNQGGSREIILEPVG